MRPKQIWKQVKAIEKSLIVETTLFSQKLATWVLDNDFSHHMTRCKRKFKTLENFDGGFVWFGDNSGAYIIGKGSIILNKDTPIHDVYFVEGLKHNLLSVSQICDSGYSISFNAKGCYIKNGKDRIIASGLRMRGNLYNLIDSTIQETSFVNTCLMSQVEENWLCHRRLGHLNFDNLARISKNKKVRGLP